MRTLCLLIVPVLAVACAHAPGTCPEKTEATSAVTPASGATGEAPVDGVKDKFVQHLNDKNSQAVFDLFGPNMREALPLPKTTSFVEGVREAKGRVTSSKVARAGQRSASYLLSAQKGDWVLSLDLDAEGKVAGMKLTEPPAPPPVVTTNDIPIALPFKGPWTVFWGGDNFEVNKHVEHNSQRRAADLVVVGANGKTFRTDGKANADYYAYGQELLAVADGTVVTAIDGVPDNAPGTMNPYFTTGNTVIVQHGPKLFSAYAHLQPGSQRVKQGSTVKKGEVLGLCGNSGNTSEAHLHFQLQDGPLFESAWGVDAVFDSVKVARGVQESTPTDYRFLKGDVVEPVQWVLGVFVPDSARQKREGTTLLTVKEGGEFWALGLRSGDALRKIDGCSPGLFNTVLNQSTYDLGVAHVVEMERKGELLAARYDPKAKAATITKLAEFTGTVPACAMATKDVVVPAYKDKELIGLKFVTLTDNSSFAKLGLKRGDLVTNAAGCSVKSPEDAKQITSRLGTIGKPVLLAVLRDGKEMTIGTKEQAEHDCAKFLSK
jgi:murein DD-endopeptidase MepM/ murein hydrolase activator NlpD